MDQTAPVKDSEKALTTLKRAIECPTCYEPLTNEPVLLDCGHVICKDCMYRLKTFDPEEAETYIECPLCRRKYACQEELPTIYILQGIVEIIAANIDNWTQQTQCSTCGEKLTCSGHAFCSLCHHTEAKALSEAKQPPTALVRTRSPSKKKSNQIESKLASNRRKRSLGSTEHHKIESKSQENEKPDDASAADDDDRPSNSLFYRRIFGDPRTPRPSSSTSKPTVITLSDDSE